MPNNISLTIRIPEELNSRLKQQAKCLGFTKTGMLKLSIHQFLDENPTNLLDVDISGYSERSFRLVLNINDYLNDLLLKASKQYGLSINSVVIRTSLLACEYYNGLLTKLGFDD